ncbi:hypothetical protein ACQ4LE_005829 [Meloidogyne hapla]|uniref:Uncharacterized protein n=1 Tax=Meloidogyne hapla TaxID=6305 RepID=A0A1I8C2Y0_MELHA
MSGRGQRLNKKRKTCPPVQLQPPKKYSLKGRVTKNDKTLTPNTTDTQLDYSLMEGTSKQTTTKEINKRKKKNEAVMEEEEENEDVVNDTERSSIFLHFFFISSIFLQILRKIEKNI